jgi:hypothetical protein
LLVIYYPETEDSIPELTPEEPHQIYKEEQKRIEAESASKPGATARPSWLLFWSICALLVFAVGVAVFAFRQNPTVHPSVETKADVPARVDPCEAFRETDPHCGWKPHWEDSGVSVSPMDGKKSEFLFLDSTDPDGTDYGRLHYAELKLCFEDGRLCGGQHVKVGVKVHGMVDPVSTDSEYSTAVRVKFDDEKPLRQTWGISDGRDMLFPNGHEKEFVAELKRHGKLILEFNYYEKAPRTVTFELSGLTDKMTASNLEN